LGAVAASVGARAAVGLFTQTIKLRAAQTAYRGVTSDSFRTQVQHFVLGRTYAGAAARVAGLAGTAGVGLYALGDPVPATGRWRLMLFDLKAEEELLNLAVARQFEMDSHRFLPPNDPRVQRVAAVLWKLVNRMDPALITGTNTIAGADTNGTPTLAAAAAASSSEHPMLREGAFWTIHVVDSPEINASVAPGGGDGSHPCPPHDTETRHDWLI
jgi:hypothetical protein